MQPENSKLIEQVRLHDHHDPHHGEFRLADVILGGQDGLVNVLGVILGVAAATSDARIVIAAGMAATFAESISMGAVAYTSKLAEHDLYHSEREREHRHIHLAPDVEIEEIRDIYRKKGFEGETLEKIVDVITSNPDVWVNVMMAEEFQMSVPEKSKAFKSAMLVGFSRTGWFLHSSLPVLLLDREPEHWTIDLYRRLDLVRCWRIQGARHGWQTFPQRHGNGNHRHPQRIGWVCGGIDLQSSNSALMLTR